MSAPVSAAREERGCLRIGPLYDFVQRLDEGADARSLHHLVGQLHMAAGDAQAKQRWVQSVRERFAATQAACFECALSDPAVDSAVADPAGTSVDPLALRAMREALQDIAVGEGVIYAGVASRGPKESAARVTAAAVKCSASRGIGFILARTQDAVADPDVLAQYVAAIVWHMRCADVAAGKVRMLEHRLSPLDLLDMLPLPSVITDAAGRAIERNQAFGAFMDAAALRLATGRLRFDDPFLQDSWQVALSEVDVTAVRQSLLVPVADGSHWRVHLVPLRCALDGDEPLERQMIIAIVEQQAALADPPQDPFVNESARPLTHAEHEVLDAVLQGHSAKVIAIARGASVNTVRSQIMAILEKTGYHNQKSLMAAFAPSGFRHSTSSISTPLPTTGRRIPPR